MKIADETNVKYIIFGAGKIGNLVLKYCKLCHFQVVAIADNDERKWGTKIKGIKVINPSDIKDKYQHCFYFVASYKYYDAIQKQLSSLGILNDRIKLFISEEEIQKEIYKKKHIKILTENKYLIFDREQYLTGKYCIRKMCSYVQGTYYKLLMNLLKPKIEKKKYHVSICAIFRDEADYLREWIEYHRVAGIEHFYLYNNFSKDNYMEVLAPYLEKDIVTLTQWEIPQGQMAAYEDCISRFSDETNWFGFFDLDEFVVPNIYKQIGDFLAEFEEKRPLVLLYWKNFGTSGKVMRDVKNGLVIEDFTVGWYKYVDIGKLFFNTAYTYLPNSKHNRHMHYMWAKYKSIELPPVNVFDKVCLYEFNPVKSDQMPVQLNHYLLKSYQEYTERKAKRGGGVHKVGMHNEKYFMEHEVKSQTLDLHAYKYLIVLKRKMKECVDHSILTEKKI